MELQNVLISDIIPNDYNPNVVEEPVMQQLKNSIVRDGFLQPIIIRKHPEQEGKHLIIDGEHRYIIMKDLGKEAIPSVILEKNEAEAMVQTINMNKLRGEFDDIKLAEVIRSLRVKYSDEEINNLMGYTPVEVQDMVDLLEYDFDSIASSNEAVDIEVGEGDVEILDEFKVQVNQWYLDTIETALEHDGRPRAEALFSLCKEYLIDKAPDKWEEVCKRKEGYESKEDLTTLVQPEEQ